MAMDMKEAREIVEAAKRRGLIRGPGEAPAPVETKEKETGKVVLPEWLQSQR